MALYLMSVLFDPAGRATAGEMAAIVPGDAIVEPGDALLGGCPAQPGLALRNALRVLSI